LDKVRLAEYNALVCEVERLQEERRNILEAIGDTPPLDGMPKPKLRHADKAGNAGARLAVLAAMIDEQLDELVALRVEIEESLLSLSSSERNLMRLRYIDGLSWAMVTERIFGYRGDYFDRFESYLRNVTRKHGRILRKIA